MDDYWGGLGFKKKTCFIYGWVQKGDFLWVVVFWTFFLFSFFLLICVKDGELRVLETGGRLVLCFLVSFLFSSYFSGVLLSLLRNTQKKGSLLYSIFLQLGGDRGG